MSASVNFFIRYENELQQCTGTEDNRKGKSNMFPNKGAMPLDPEPNHWLPPPVDYWKLNTDASFLADTGDASRNAGLLEEMHWRELREQKPRQSGLDWVS